MQCTKAAPTWQRTFKSMRMLVALAILFGSGAVSAMCVVEPYVWPKG